MFSLMILPALLGLTMACTATDCGNPTQMTEVSTVYLKPDTNVTTGEAKAVWDDAIRRLRDEGGVQGMWYGYQHENKDRMQVVAIWPSRAHQEAFQWGPNFGAFIGNVSTIMSGPELFTRFGFPSSVLPAVQAPVTEFATMYVPYENAPNFRQVRNEYEANLNQAQELYGLTSGQALDDIQNDAFNATSDPDRKGKLWVALVGWETVEAHYRWAELPDGGVEVNPLLFNNTRALELAHAPLTKVI